MKNNEWYDLGEQIRDLVQSAVDSQDFRRLNQAVTGTINKAVSSAVDGVKKGMEKAGEAYETRSAGYYEKYPNKEIRGNFKNANYSSQVRKKEPYDTSLFSARPQGGSSGIVMAVLGFVIGSVFGIAALASVFVGLLTFAAPLLATGTFLGILFLAGMILGGKGISLMRRAKRFKKYVRQLNGREFCQISELCSAAGKSPAAVARDLKIMIDKGMFLQGHLDEEKTCLMVTQNAYNQYLAAVQARKMRQQEERERKKKQNDPSRSEEYRTILREGNEYIRHIHQANDAIADPVMSEKLSRLELIMTKIFRQVEKNPDAASDLHKFMKYYLPTTTKLVDAYQELIQQPAAGENITGTKKEIEDTLDTINSAFEKLLDRFFQDTAWDISTDITVMKTMLAQEGLVEEEFKMPTSTKG
ncbi:MAG: 5-bromo-4-chloroindolyl phosphate hydrolysis family protein [Ruminococcus sp.]|jgi:5-bromo-4-chloroindolyl phosphate hydrolysis protein